MAQKRTIDIDINTNADQAAKEFDNLGKATKVANDSLEGLNKTFEEANGDIQPLTARMGEAEDRLYELALAGDTTSKEYQGLLNKVGEYRKVQIQTDIAVDGAATTLGEKLGGALTGATSGFAAVQGVMALTGGESEALEKSLLKVQGAMAIQQGVQGLVVSYRQLGGATGLATKAQAALNFVMGLNPFVKAAAAVVAIIAVIQKLTGFMDPLIDKFKEFTDFIGITNFAEEEQRSQRKRRAAEHAEETKRQEELDKRAFNARQQQYDNEIALMEALGQSSFKLRQQKLKDAIAVQQQNAKDAAAEVEYIEGQMRRNNAFAKSRQKMLDEQVAKQAEANLAISSMQNQLTINEIKENDKQVADEEKTNEEKLNAYKQYLQNRKDASRKIEDLQNKLMEEGLEKELELNRDNFRRQREDLKAQGKQKQEIIDLLNQLELKKEQEIQEKFRQQRLDNFTSEIETLKLFEDAKTEVALKGVEERIGLTDEEKANNLAVQKAKVQFANDSLSAISNLVNAFAGESEKSQKKAFQINKAIGITQAIINTAGAISAAINPAVGGLGIPAGLPGAALAAATGAAQIATIAKTEFQGGGGGETPSVDAGGGAAQAPSFNVVGDSSVNQLAQLQQQPVQAFVVSGEVTTSQALDRNRVENATL